jgi:REP element-mobilizing transposase RayT
MPSTNLYKGHRNSYTELNEVYFWTITIKEWIHLLKADEYKTIIIRSLQWLIEQELVRIYGYVIMPNHIHLLWEQLKMNGKEFPKNSFEKFTAHNFKKKLKTENPEALEQFVVTASDRIYNFWQRDPLAVLVFSREMASQKLDYMHFNPLQEHWQLCTQPEEYKFSSAAFYEYGVDEFKILTHYMDVF